MSKSWAVIVGAGPGVGLSVAKKFGSQGFGIVLVARNPERLDTYVNELRAADIEAYGIAADASVPAEIQAAFDAIKRNYGELAVLVYNAAVIKQGAPSSLQEEELLNDLKVNVAGALSSALQVIPDWVERQRGTILFTGGGLALQPSASVASLSIGKAAIRSLAFTLGEELAPSGIYVGTVTISGYVRPNTHFDPDLIAQVYWDLHEKRNEREFVYQ